MKNIDIEDLAPVTGGVMNPLPVRWTSAPSNLGGLAKVQPPAEAVKGLGDLVNRPWWTWPTSA